MYDDPNPGARAEVVLFIDTNENTATKTPANDSGYYGDLLNRHGINTKWNRDSVASSDSGNHGDEATEQFIIGTVSISPEMSWVSMDGKVEEIFQVRSVCVCVVGPFLLCFLLTQHHITNVDPEGSLGLSEESIYCYVVGEERRQVGNALLPPITPYQALANKLTIRVHMKGGCSLQIHTGSDGGVMCCCIRCWATVVRLAGLQDTVGHGIAAVVHVYPPGDTVAGHHGH